MVLHVSTQYGRGAKCELIVSSLSPPIKVRRYNTARILKAKQDDYCTKATAGQWEGLGDFPADLQYQPLVDILRGKTKVVDTWILVKLSSRVLTKSSGSDALLRGRRLR